MKRLIKYLLRYLSSYELEQELVSRGHAVALWSYDDVIEHGEEKGIPISEAEARDIMHGIHYAHDCNCGITWDTLDYWVWEIERKRKK